MLFGPPPPAASWQHQQARAGFEVAYFQPVAGGWLVDGTTSAVEDGQTWAVTYRIELDAAWVTRVAHISSRTVTGARAVHLDADGAGHWRVDGIPAPGLDGCLDVDLESSAMTNTFPVHRLGLPAGAEASAPAAYVRALDLTAARLEQTYRRTASPDAQQRYDYCAPAFGFTAALVYDESGLVVDYPGIARRAS